jgi:hypothetical protein
MGYICRGGRNELPLIVSQHRSRCTNDRHALDTQSRYYPLHEKDYLLRATVPSLGTSFCHITNLIGPSLALHTIRINHEPEPCPLGHLPARTDDTNTCSCTAAPDRSRSIRRLRVQPFHLMNQSACRSLQADIAKVHINRSVSSLACLASLCWISPNTEFLFCPRRVHN